MAKVIVVVGHGPGISDAVARRFGKAGYSVAIVARNADRLAKAAAALTAAGIKAQAFPADAGNPSALRKLVQDVRAVLGPISVVHWNAYVGGAGDLKTSTTDELRTVLDVAVHGLIAVAQAALPDLKAERGALLVTGGGFAFYDAQVDAAATQWGAAGLAISKAAQHKTVGLLHQALASDGVYVGEVVVTGSVKGTAFDSGSATLEAAAIAEKFWELTEARSPASATI
jgi:NAD(P)-dependent dehydrogenase (short-subunit alcohol dehydrogenase family)